MRKKSVIFILLIVLCVLLAACGEQKAYDVACALFEDGQYAEAIEMFRALGDYSDSADRIRIAETRLEQTSSWHESSQAENECALRYAEAFGYLEAGQTNEAYKAFASLGSYRDAAERLEHFTVIRAALVGEDVYLVRGDENLPRGSADYTYGAEGRAVSRSGFCKLDRYGWAEDFNCHYSYDDTGLLTRVDAVNASGSLSFTIVYGYDEHGSQIREQYADSTGTVREFTRAYSYVDATDNSDGYTKIVESEIVGGAEKPLTTWQESYCAFGVASEKSGEYTLVHHYSADGRCTDSVQLMPDGESYVTVYRYDDVYVYTP